MNTRREAFDAIVLEVAEELDRLLEPRGLVVEYAVMDIPTDLGQAWSPEVPLARSVTATRSTPPRIIIFRRPVEARVSGQPALTAMVRSVLSDQISDLFAIPIEELDTGFDED